MKILLTIITCITIAPSLFSQTPVSKNHYTFSLVNGVTKNEKTSSQGADRFKNALSVYHGLNFQYTRNFNDHFSASGIAGFGFLPFTYKISNVDSLYGTSGESYFGRLHYQIFSNLAIQGAYRNRLSEKYAYKVFTGLGIRNLATSYITTSASTSSTGDYTISMRFLNGAKPYATLGFGIIKQIKSKDEISLSLAYEQSFKDIYSGTYALNGGANGTFANSGSNFNLALAYTFTGVKKQERVNSFKAAGSDSKAARKLYKKEIRYIDPRSTFFSIAGGLGFGTNRINDPAKNIGNAHFGSFVPRISLEKGIAKNYFAELGFNTFPFWSTLAFGNSGMASGSQAFTAYQISLGAGKRMITKNNYNIINFHAGLSFGFTNLKKGPYGQGQSSTSQIDTNTQQINYLFIANSNYTAKNIFVTSAYLGASKDFRLARNFYLSLNYRFQQGFYTLFQQDVSYSVDNNTTFNKAKITINGSSHTYQLGFKLKFDERKKN